MLGGIIDDREIKLMETAILNNSMNGNKKQRR